MEIQNEKELQRAVDEAGELLQEIQNYCGREKKDRARVRFPRGYLYPVAHHKSRLGFVIDEHTRTNLCYALMMLDVLRWLIIRTDLYRVPQEMVIKEAIVLHFTLELSSRSVSTLVALTLLVADLFTFKIICGFPPRCKSVWCSFMLLCTPPGPRLWMCPESPTEAHTAALWHFLVVGGQESSAGFKTAHDTSVYFAPRAV